MLPDINKPFYFYYIEFTDPGRPFSTTNEGIMTPQYLYDHNKFAKLDPILEGWKRVVVNKWHMYQEDPGALTRLEVMNAIQFKLGPDYLNQIPLIRYPLSPNLGMRTKILLNNCRLYRINLNNPLLDNDLRVRDVYWGYDKMVPIRKLDRYYYDRVSSSEYFKYYQDSLPVQHPNRLVDQLNTIYVKPKNGYLSNRVVEDITGKFNVHDMFDNPGQRYTRY